MKILAKLLIGFLAVALICAVVGLVGVMQLQSMERSLSSVSGRAMPALISLNSIYENMLKIKNAIRSLSIQEGLNDDVFTKRQYDNIEKARAAYKPELEKYRAMSKTRDEEQLFKEFDTLIAKAAAYNNELLTNNENARKATGALKAKLLQDAYLAIAGDRRAEFDNMITALEALIAYDSDYYGTQVPKKAMAAAKIGENGLIAISAASILAAILLGVILGSGISKSLKQTVDIVNKLAAGDASTKAAVKSKDEVGMMASALNVCVDSINALITDAGMLVDAALEGRLKTRADASRHQGDYRRIVEGVNKTLDAVITPLYVAADYVERISKGDIPPKITDEYKGDFNLIKTNLNVCIDAVDALVSDAGTLAQAAVEGKLATRADASKHQGDYRKIVEGVNRTLDLVIGPINETIRVMRKLADGDLTTSLEGDYSGDFDALKAAITDSLTTFNDIIGQVNVAVEQVADGSQQVSQAAQALSQGATEQASSLEQITSSITEVSSRTKQNTESAIKVNGLAKTAKANAEQGNKQMQDLVAAMADINKSADEINKIVKAIDDISFQINLLALNANVEAARAGKYGKGFAVVAEEVRNLAVRSANSVKDTTRMVGETIANIERGNSMVETTAKQLTEIVDGAAQVATLAEEVAVAGKEQTQGLEQISTGLDQIDQVTQANTASAEESASASEELSSQAQEVKAMLSRFRVKARESKLTEAEMMQMLKSEMARQSLQAKGRPAAIEAKPAAKGPKPRVNPADVISLDDANFGKF